MNEEEKKAIDNFRRLDFFDYDWQIRDGNFETRDDMLEYAEKMQEIILNLLEKQQKEIEDLKEITQNYNAIGGETFGDDRIIVCSMKYFDDGYFKKNYIFKDKIREKIKAFQNIKKEIIKNENKLSRASITYDIVRNDYCEKMLEELLEENNDGDHIPRID